MSSRCTIRLPDQLHARLQRVADTRGCGVSDVIRQALVAFLDGQGAGGHDTSPSLADQPTLTPPARETECPPEPPSPQVSEAARPPLREIPSWEEFKRRRLQGSGESPPAISASSVPGAAQPASTSPT
jgi:hypothetical protein